MKLVLSFMEECVATKDYDSIIKYCLSVKTLDKSTLCEEFDLTSDECSTLINKLFNDGVLYTQDNDGFYHADSKYKHPDDILKEELKSDKKEIKKSHSHTGKHIKLVNKKVLFSLLVFFTASIWIATVILFSTKAFLWMGILFPVVILGVSFSFYKKTGLIIPCFIVIILCSISIYLINDITPMFGEKYEYRIRRESIEKDYQQEVNTKNMYIQQAESSLLKILKDPSSADISGSYVSKTGAVCGNVNSKNSFNAYTGYQRYIYLLSTPFIDDGSDSFNKTWNEHCD